MLWRFPEKIPIQKNLKVASVRAFFNFFSKKFQKKSKKFQKNFKKISKKFKKNLKKI
jgi:hypothetical protein